MKCSICGRVIGKNSIFWRVMLAGSYLVYDRKCYPVIKELKDWVTRRHRPLAKLPLSEREREVLKLMNAPKKHPLFLKFSKN